MRNRSKLVPGRRLTQMALLVGVVLCAAAGGRAEPPEVVSCSVDRDRIALGNSVELTLEVKGRMNAVYVPGFKTTGGTHRTSTTVNGVSMQSVTVRLTPLYAGTHTIKSVFTAEQHQQTFLGFNKEWHEVAVNPVTLEVTPWALLGPEPHGNDAQQLKLGGLQLGAKLSELQESWGTVPWDGRLDEWRPHEWGLGYKSHELLKDQRWSGYALKRDGDVLFCSFFDDQLGMVTRQVVLKETVPVASIEGELEQRLQGVRELKRREVMYASGTLVPQKEESHYRKAILLEGDIEFTVIVAHCTTNSYDQATAVTTMLVARSLLEMEVVPPLSMNDLARERSADWKQTLPIAE